MLVHMLGFSRSQRVGIEVIMYSIDQSTLPSPTVHSPFLSEKEIIALPNL